jgi:DNA-binding GntR family transcriptional regulator
MTSSTLTPVAVPVSLEMFAYEAIKEAILTFKLQPGENLIESDLAKQLNISKTPVRESLARLARERFVTKIPYKGYYVSMISQQGMIELFDIRASLEGLAVRRAVERITGEEIACAKQLIDEHLQFASAGDIALASITNRKFHDLFIQASGYEQLIEMLKNLDEHLRRYRILSNYQEGRLDKSALEHQQILRLVTERDALGASAAASKHILSVSADLADLDFDELIERIKQNQK